MGSRYTSSRATSPPTAVNLNCTPEVSNGSKPPSIPISGDGFQPPDPAVVDALTAVLEKA